MDSVLNCSGLSIPRPTLPGATIDILEAHLVSDASAYVPEAVYTNHGPINVTNVSFCAVSLVHTHIQQTDSVNTQVWPPIDDTWNGRMMGVGGGGFHCGLYPENMMAMLGAVGEGYAAVSTDCGHTMLQELSDWLLEYPGKVNLHLLEDFASTALNDAAVLGKSVAESFDGKLPSYSYLSGCSQVRHESTRLVSAIVYLTNTVVRRCDGLDGVRDGIVSNIDACNMNAFDLIGTHVPCGEKKAMLSESAAIVATAAWQGPVHRSGMHLWTGVDIVSNLTSDFSSQCSPSGTCTGLPVEYSSDWIRLAVRKNPSFDLDAVTYDEFTRIFHDSMKEYNSIVGMNGPDLSEFRRRGGKILAYHGLEAVAMRDPHVRSFYRLFEAPGLGHCWSPSGLYPSTIFDDMVAWVEKGRVPRSLPASFADKDGAKNERILCPYPEKAVYNRHGDTKSRGSSFCSAAGLGFSSNVQL
ncbi:tannase and feruloyl esterase-domain-containing protein [Aspergillus varians]